MERPCSRHPLAVGCMVSQACRQVGHHAHSAWLCIVNNLVQWVEDIPMAVSWTMPSLFIKFYLMDISGPFCGLGLRRGHKNAESVWIRCRWWLGAAPGTFWALCLTTCPHVPWEAQGMGVCGMSTVCWHLWITVVARNQYSDLGCDNLYFMSEVT